MKIGEETDLKVGQDPRFVADLVIFSSSRSKYAVVL